MGAYDDGGMTKSILSAAKVEADRIAAEARAQELAAKKAEREAGLAERSRARREAAGLPTNTGYWADRTGTSSNISSGNGTNSNITSGNGTSGTNTSGTGQTSGSSSSAYISPDVTPTPATPATASAATASTATPAVKTAPIDTVLFNDDEVSPELMEKLLFENIGGHELINIARNDIINGQDISYQPIKNLSSLQQQYNPNNILGLQSTSDKYFANFAIKLENKATNVANGPFGANVYIDPLTGDLVIDAVNIEVDEQIEIEITLSGTIYEADLTGSES
jgi:hypothetical protein